MFTIGRVWTYMFNIGRVWITCLTLGVWGRTCMAAGVHMSAWVCVCEWLYLSLSLIGRCTRVGTYKMCDFFVLFNICVLCDVCVYIYSIYSIFTVLGWRSCSAGEELL